MNKFSQILISLSLISLANMAFAFQTGSFLGLQLGEVNTHYDASDLGATSADVRNYSFTGRAIIGHQILPNFGIEVGVLAMRKIRVKNINATSSDARLKQYAVDIMARVNWTFAKNLDAIARAGASYLYAIPDDSLRNLSINDFSRRRVAHYRPTFGTGIAFHTSDAFALEASWQHILKHRALADVDFIALGFNLYA
jgi:OmpA-like transmembrane domain